MAELIIPGPAGRIEARYTEPAQEGAPIALWLEASAHFSKGEVIWRVIEPD